MSRIHFLNVKRGDCSIIEHESGLNTVIDICNAKPIDPALDILDAVVAYDDKRRQGIIENFRQAEFPANPISYMNKLGIRNVYRYVQTHPDMDHMDGIEILFQEFKPIEFWDTDNKKEIMDSDWEKSLYQKSDWKFYKNLRDTNPSENPQRLTLYSNIRNQCYTQVPDDSGSLIDGLQVLAPTWELITEANKTDNDFNSCSYVILYTTPAGTRTVFSGDSHDKTWNHILEYHRAEVSNIDLLIAPHHGRDSGRSYDFLDTLNPTLTFFGNAPQEYLADNAWSNRGLQFVTNNQANCMIVDASTNPMMLYVTYENFARRVNPFTNYSEALRAWDAYPIKRNSIP